MPDESSSDPSTAWEEQLLRWVVDSSPHDCSGVEILREALPGYEIIECVGKGGMGTVYKAKHLALQRMVAVKFLHLENAAQASLTEERLQREATTLAQLRHPHIVAVYDAGFSRDGDFYLIMEWVDGLDLGAWMEARGVPPYKTAISWAIQAARGLDFAHRQGIIHRDIKPSNLLLTKEGEIKIADFGLAHTSVDREKRLTAPSQYLGTDCYAAPEIYDSSQSADARSDLYSLAVTLYELLTGKLPRGRFSAPGEMVKELPQVFDDVLMRALSAAPERRHRTMEEFASALEKPGQDAFVLKRRLRMLRINALGFLLMLGVAGTLFHQHRTIVKARSAAVEQRREAEKLIDYLINQMMWQIPNDKEQLRQFQPMLDHLDAYFEHFDRPESADADFLYAKATFHQVKIVYANATGRKDLADQWIRQLPAVRDRHRSAASPSHDTAAANAGQARLYLAQWLEDENHQTQEAQQQLVEGEDLLRQHLQHYPTAYGARMVLAELLTFEAELLAKNQQPQQATELYQESKKHLDQLMTINPDHSEVHATFAAVAFGLGSLSQEKGAWQDALVHYQEMEQAYHRSMELLPPTQQNALRIRFNIVTNLGTAYEKLRQSDKAREGYANLLDALEQYQIANPNAKWPQAKIEELQKRLDAQQP